LSRARLHDFTINAFFVYRNIKSNATLINQLEDFVDKKLIDYISEMLSEYNDEEDNSLEDLDGDEYNGNGEIDETA